MGASASVAGAGEALSTRAALLELMAAESQLSEDASDLTNMEDALAEAKRLRAFVKQVNSDFQADTQNRADLKAEKIMNQSFRGGSLQRLLSESNTFVENLLADGYESMSPNSRFAGLRTLRSFLKSPALAVMLARKNVQEDLRKQVEATDDEDINSYIIGHYASSNNIHDVSLIRERAKTKFTNALAKLKGKFLLNQLMMGKKKEDGTAKMHKRTASFIMDAAYLTHLSLTDKNKSDLERCLDRMGDFNFDVWQLVSLTNNSPLLVTGMELFKRWELDERLNIKDELIARFFSSLEQGYKKNPYHNSVHGADVMYTVNSFIHASKTMKEELDAPDLFAALIAAAAHDYKHDGVNNAFHVNTSSDLALRYNDISVLESMHSAELFIMCKDEGKDIFSVLDSGQKKEARKIITTAILGTDMTKHFNHIADFESRLAAEKAIAANPEAAAQSGTEQRLEKGIMIEMALHCADISNPVKDISVYKKWVIVVMTEFYEQGDKERELGMPISPMFDRDNSSVTKTQCGFIEFIIKPIYRVWGDFIPELKENFEKNLAVGKAFGWDEYYAGVIDGSIVEAEREHHLYSSRKLSIEEGEEGEEEGGGEEGKDPVDHVIEKKDEEEEIPPEMVESASTPEIS
ncbi:hypothetical protein TL16_g00545 [Triparma laevis f. inornata]|uniref:Phosphodiesterase n=2 Tax=Triparma laevis TaxID=1534972 RepID=A0A9W7KWM1_9STRA|nr:hypothetical protein TL16_g00545 [Triparma laevis f. inornata]GMI14194.1 hypothetical protein TrLO_g13051 [Triparma laevis f. longispina]